MIVSFGTRDLKLYTVKFVCFFFRTFSCFFFFFATACTYCFLRGEDAVNVSVEVGWGRRDKRQGWNADFLFRADSSFQRKKVMQI